MITVRQSNERGLASHGWLESRHTFSFAHYYDPRFMGVSALRVINDDWVKPGMGFETHPHRDMEIISVVLEGQIAHKDTMGYETVLKPGEVQVMSAGTGLLHSEFNPSATEDLNFLQIWIKPNQLGVEPRYQQKDFTGAEGVTLVVSPDGRDGSLEIHQDAYLYKVNLANQTLEVPTTEGRIYYVHVYEGRLIVNGTELHAGDAVTISDEEALQLEVNDQVEALLFDLP